MAQSQVGKIYVGANQMFPGVQVPSGPEVPTSGLIGWFDASDYTSGTTWVDRSANGLNLTLSGTYSKVSSPIEGVYLSNAYARSATTALVSGGTGTEYTHIEILKLTSTSAGQGTFCISSNVGGDDAGSISDYRLGTAQIGWLRNAVGGYGNILNTQTYNTTNIFFIARRFIYGETIGAGVYWGFGSDATALTFYNSTANYTSTAGGTTMNWNLGAAGRMVIGAPSSTGSYKGPAYYGVNLFYNRAITDQEVTDIYNYYKSTYSLV